MISAQAAYELLQEGNRRYAADVARDPATVSAERRAGVAGGQSPIAAVLACADSRVAPELVFDQGLGDLFSVRVAGNIIGPHQLGSIEFCLDSMGTNLVVVLGHTGCGAVHAAWRHLEGESGDLSPALRSLVEAVVPAIEPVHRHLETADERTLLARAGRASVERTADGLARALKQGGARPDVAIVGAEYCLETGAVEFFHGLPPG